MIIYSVPYLLAFHSVEVRAKQTMNLGSLSTKVPKLNEAATMELGASLMKEIIFYTIGGVTIMVLYSKYRAKKLKKEEKQELLMNKLAEDIQTIQEMNKKIVI